MWRIRKEKLKSLKHHQLHQLFQGWTSQGNPIIKKILREADELLTSFTQATISPQCAYQEESPRRTPVPSDSPLLKEVTYNSMVSFSIFSYFQIQKDPIIQRIRSFNRSLKKAHSFRISREKSTEPVGRVKILTIVDFIIIRVRLQQRWMCPWLDKRSLSG